VTGEEAQFEKRCFTGIHWTALVRSQRQTHWYTCSCNKHFIKQCQRLKV